MPEDLQYLTEENIDELGAAMTHVSASLFPETTTASSTVAASQLPQVEKMRLQAALQALRDE